MRFLSLFLLSIIYSPVTSAETIQNLQQRANFAYEQMIQAKLNAERTARDFADLDNKHQHIKKQLSEARQIAEAARIKSEAAHSKMEHATKRWKHASDTLAHQWRQTR